MRMYYSDNGYYLFNKRHLIACLHKIFKTDWKNFLKTEYIYDDAEQVSDYFDRRGWKYKRVVE